VGVDLAVGRKLTAERPFLAELVIELDEGEVVARDEWSGEGEAGCVQTVALREVIRRRIERQVFENLRTRADAARIERLERIRINRLKRAARIAELHHAFLERVSGHDARDGGRPRIAASFVSQEEESFVLEDRAADGAAETIVEQERTFDAEPVVRPR